MNKRNFDFRKLKWENYIWLLYLPYSVFLYFPIQSWIDGFWVAMCGMFLIVYIGVAELPRWRPWLIPLEMLITGSFAIFNFNYYLLIFTAWQVGFLLSSSPKKYVVLFFAAYYSIFLAGMLELVYLYPHTPIFNGNQGMMESTMGLIFPVISPIMSYIFSVSIRYRRQMRQDYRRLETIVRRGERERIARDLHDTLGQSFSMITIKTELAQKLLEKNADQAKSELVDIAQTSRENLQLVRKIVNNLHQLSLSEILFEQSNNLTQAGIFMMTDGEGEAIEWSTEIQNDFSAVLVEAITNIIRHAKARTVHITFDQVDGQYRVRVQDDGRAKTFVRPQSNGITGMQERMQEKQGHFEIETNQIGTLVTFSLPKEEQ